MTWDAAVRMRNMSHGMNLDHTDLTTCMVDSLPGVHKHDVGGSCQVERYSSCLETHQEDSDIRVMGELVDHAIPVVHAHAALEPHTLHTSLHDTA